MVIRRPHQARKPHRGHPQQRRGGQTSQGEQHMNAKHVGQIKQQRGKDHHQLQHHAINELPHQLHIASHTVNDRTSAVLIEETKRQALQLVVHHRPQLHHHLPLHQFGAGNGQPKGNGSANQGTHKHKTGQQAHHLQRRPTDRRLPAKRIMGLRCGRILGVPYHINGQARHAQPHRQQSHGR